MREEGRPVMCVVFATLDVTACAVTSDVFKPPESLRPHLLNLKFESSTLACSFIAESHLLDRHSDTCIKLENVEDCGGEPEQADIEYYVT